MVEIFRPGVIWIPPQYSASYKLTVTRSDETIDTITKLITNLEVEDMVTDGIGKFSFEVWNPDLKYKDKWQAMDIINYYKDYLSGTATTLRFRGRIEKVSYIGNKIKVTGRTDALKLMGKTVTQSYSMECSLILKSLIDLYGDEEFTYANVSASNTTLTVNWYQKPFWECIQELCNSAEGNSGNKFDCYVDSSLDFNFFEHGSRENTDEGIVHTINLVNISEFADDSAQIKNKIIVYGAEQDGIKILYTAEDTDSQATYGIREEIISDSNITSYEQAKDFADYRLSSYKDPPNTGELTGILLATIQPGQKIVLSSPADKIEPGLYTVVGYKDKISERGDFYTTIKISTEPKKIANVLKSNIENQQKSQNLTYNPYEMKYSYNFLFNTDEGTHSGTQIADGVLKLLTGDLGTWISPVRTAASNITEAYLYMVGDTLSGASVYASSDGANYELIPNKTKINITNPGKNLYIKAVISNTNTKIDSLSLLYK